MSILRPSALLKLASASKVIVVRTLPIQFLLHKGTSTLARQHGIRKIQYQNMETRKKGVGKTFEKRT
jgi:hypothetical protein